MSIYGTSCNGCFAAYTTVDERATFVLPDEMSFEEGALLEPAGVAMRAVEEASIVPGDTVVVNGCGPIGLMAIPILFASGAANVIAVDLDEYRLGMASKFGAVTINAKNQNPVEVIQQLTKNRGGADVVIELSGAASAYENIFDFLRLEGCLITVGHPSGPVSISIQKSVNLKGIRIRGVFGRRIWSTWWNLSSLITSKKVNILDVATHRYHFSQYQEAFDQIKMGAGKILFIKG
jgi:threonine 3-dehydrogenase